jgi:hypothetical protein
MTQSSTDSLVERLRGPHRQSECGNFAEVHPGFLNELDIALTAAEAKVARMGEALEKYERLLTVSAIRSDAQIVAPLWLHAADEASERARSALQSEKDREGGE